MNIKDKLDTLLMHMQDTYYACLPFGVPVQRLKYKRMAAADFDALVQMTDLDDDVFKRLSSLGFKIDDEHQDLRAIIQRGQIVPYAMDKDTVEIDAKIWMDDKLADIQRSFVAYELAGRIEVYPTYEPERDVVLVTMRPIARTYIEDMQRYKHVNLSVTIGWLTAMISTVCTILL